MFKSCERVVTQLLTSQQTALVHLLDECHQTGFAGSYAAGDSLGDDTETEALESLQEAVFLLQLAVSDPSHEVLVTSTSTVRKTESDGWDTTALLPMGVVPLNRSEARSIHIDKCTIHKQHSDSVSERYEQLLRGNSQRRSAPTLKHLSSSVLPPQQVEPRVAVSKPHHSTFKVSNKTDHATEDVAVETRDVIEVSVAGNRVGDSLQQWNNNLDSLSEFMAGKDEKDDDTPSRRAVARATCDLSNMQICRGEMQSRLNELKLMQRAELRKCETNTRLHECARINAQGTVTAAQSSVSELNVARREYRGVVADLEQCREMGSAVAAALMTLEVSNTNHASLE